HHAGSDEFSMMHFLDKVTEHRLGNLKISDHSVLHRADSHDVSRGAAQHPLGLFAYGQDVGGSRLDGDHRRFAQDYPLVPDINERVGGAKIDANVVGKEAFKLRKHAADLTAGRVGLGATGVKREPPNYGRLDI